jgi:hypothetical protein
VIQTQFLTEIERLPIPDRLTLLEDALRVIRRDLQQEKPASRQADRSKQLTDAAKNLLADYTVDAELTAFTVWGTGFEGIRTC